MKKETNGGMLKTYKVHCLKGNCEDIVEVEEIGYLDGTMHIRCIKCGYVQQTEGLTPI